MTAEALLAKGLPNASTINTRTMEKKPMPMYSGAPGGISENHFHGSVMRNCAGGGH